MPKVSFFDIFLPRDLGHSSPGSSNPRRRRLDREVHAYAQSMREQQLMGQGGVMPSAGMFRPPPSRGPRGSPQPPGGISRGPGATGAGGAGPGHQMFPTVSGT
jgi:hypothetical protein